MTTFFSFLFGVEEPANAAYLSYLMATKELLSFESRKDILREEVDPKPTGKKAPLRHFIYFAFFREGGFSQNANENSVFSRSGRFVVVYFY